MRESQRETLGGNYAVRVLVRGFKSEVSICSRSEGFYGHLLPVNREYYSCIAALVMDPSFSNTDVARALPVLSRVQSEGDSHCLYARIALTRSTISQTQKAPAFRQGLLTDYDFLSGSL